MTRMRQVIAKRMVESLQTSAQLTTVVEVDVTKIARLRDAAKANFAAVNGVKLSFLPFFALAAVEALRVHPKVNASVDMDDNTITYHDGEHLGVAVDTERGLLVPVIKDAGDLNLAGLAKRIADLAERTRTNKVTPDELGGGTFTLTNTGSRGALFDTPIINQPQVGILGTGTVVKRAVVVDDSELGEIIVPRSMVYLALSLRPPDRRRRRRRPVPDHGQGAAGSRQLRGRPRSVTPSSTRFRTVTFTVAVRFRSAEDRDRSYDGQMRIVVGGSSGLIGSALVRRLQARRSRGGAAGSAYRPGS